MDISTVNAELESVGKKKGRKGSLDNKYSASKLSRAKDEVEKYAYSNGTQAIINCFKSNYPQCSFLHTSINSWKRKFNNQKEDFLPPIFNKRGRPNLVRDDFYKDKRSGNWSCDSKKDGCFYR